MLGVSLALLAAAVYGAGDFVGGLATRRISVLFVVGAGQVAGLAALALLSCSLAADLVRHDDLLWGAASGVSTAVGITLLYRALATGRMSVAAPVTALAALSLPVLVAYAGGEWPGWAPTLGIALAAVSVTLISREEDRPDGAAGSAARALALSLAAGFGIGVFYITMKQTQAASGLWPLVAARAVSAAIFLAVALALLRRWRAAAMPAATLWGAAILSGLFDSAANALYLLSSRMAPLAIVATLTSLYPASTVLLARGLLHERLRPAQIAGLLLAVIAVILIVGPT
ncbi:MAG: DMT family transporter [Alphaproteobacteria bacterium]|nr:DMT family transporter [Alphaproteobacteria bacterium]